MLNRVDAQNTLRMRVLTSLDVNVISSRKINEPALPINESLHMKPLLHRRGTMK